MNLIDSNTQEGKENVDASLKNQDADRQMLV